MSRWLLVCDNFWHEHQKASIHYNTSGTWHTSEHRHIRPSTGGCRSTGVSFALHPRVDERKISVKAVILKSHSSFMRIATVTTILCMAWHAQYVLRLLSALWHKGHVASYIGMQQVILHCWVVLCEQNVKGHCNIMCYVLTWWEKWHSVCSGCFNNTCNNDVTWKKNASTQNNKIPTHHFALT